MTFKSSAVQKLQDLSEKWFVSLSLFIYNILIIIPVQKFSKNLEGNFIDFVYFLSYRTEFMKRGFIGTLFDIFHVPLTTATLSLLFVMGCNAVFVLMYYYLRHSLRDYPTVVFRCFIIFFILAPFTAWNWGFDFLRTDVFLLAAELLILIKLSIHSKRFGYFNYAIPILIGINLCIHEAFLFLNLPIILIFLFYNFNIKTTREKTIGLISVAVVIMVMAVLFTYGKVSAENLEKIYYSIYQKALPTDLMSNPYPIWVISSSFKTNILFTLSDYTRLSFWLSIGIVLPYLCSYLYLYFRMVRIKILSAYNKLVVLSPLLCFPMFLIGVDTYRWLSIMMINMLIVVAYLLSIKAVPLPAVTTKIKIAVLIVFLYSFTGPMGGRLDSLPYCRAAYHFLSPR